MSKATEQMERRKGHGLTFKQLADEFGTSKTTAHRKISKSRADRAAESMMRQGYTKVSEK